MPTIHPTADVQSSAIGQGTRIWQFCAVLSGARIGADCNINAHCFIENEVVIGDRVTVKCGAHLWDGITVEDDVFIGPCVAFTNDIRPRSKRYPEEYRKTRLRTGCSVGANASILPVTIGRWAMVAAGAVVTRDVPDFALVRGNPARCVAWVCRCGTTLAFDDSGAAACTCGYAYRITPTSLVEEAGS